LGKRAATAETSSGSVGASSSNRVSKPARSKHAGQSTPGESGGIDRPQREQVRGEVIGGLRKYEVITSGFRNAR
jgi:hypothetical protein